LSASEMTTTLNPRCCPMSITWDCATCRDDVRVPGHTDMCQPRAPTESR
jgi:hypothetical protein